jgi:hypothetical protein
MLSWIGKLPGLAVRLALLFEYMWWAGQCSLTAPEPETVGVGAVTAALAFLESYALPMARRTFGDAATPPVDRDPAALAKWLTGLADQPQIVNARDLRHKGAIPGCREAERYDKAFAELVEPAGFGRRHLEQKAVAGAARTLSSIQLLREPGHERLARRLQDDGARRLLRFR